MSNYLRYTKNFFAFIVIAIALIACGGGGGGGDTNSGGNSPPPDTDPAEPSVEQLHAASKLLNLATFGPTPEDIFFAAEQGLGEWLDQQFAVPASSHMAIVNRYIDRYGLDFNADPLPGVYRRFAFWEHALTAPDQLRQLTAYALSQVFVVSDNVDAFLLDPRALATYYDVLADNAFGNFRDLLLEVTLSPAMGFYLSHVNNAKTNPLENTFPDENYAREVMQLFSIGLFELNQDGTLRLDDEGNPIPTYDNQTIREFSRVFTGLGYGPEEPGGAVVFGLDRRIFSTPMVMFEAFHETGSKRLLNDILIPDGQTGMQDVEAAIDNLFNHPNVGPFIGKQLIQRLVTSNPSPEYVSRVAAAFNGENGNPRGDMESVIRAILEDPEANSGVRLREPFRRYVALNRSLGATSDDGTYPGVGFIAQYLTQQNVMSAPSVFNFYLPDYTPPGELGEIGLKAPEFQISDASTVIGMINLYAYALYGDQSIDTVDGLPTIRLNLQPYADLAGDTAALLDQIDLVFFSGELGGAERSIISTAVEEYRNAGVENIDIARVALYLALSSASYAVQGGV